MKKYINLLLILEAIICILMCVFGGGKVTFVNTLLTFPFKPIAVGLRKLSFLGGVGNIFSWLLFLLICSIPLIILIAKLIRKRFVLEDILLVVISLIVALALYHMININLMASQMIVPIVENDALYCVLGAIVYSIIAGYLVIKVIRKFAKANKEEVKRYFNNVFIFCLIFQYDDFFCGKTNELFIKKILPLFTTVLYFLCCYYFAIITCTPFFSMAFKISAGALSSVIRTSISFASQTLHIALTPNLL